MFRTFEKTLSVGQSAIRLSYNPAQANIGVVPSLVGSPTTAPADDVTASLPRGRPSNTKGKKVTISCIIMLLDLSIWIKNDGFTKGVQGRGGREFQQEGWAGGALLDKVMGGYFS